MCTVIFPQWGKNMLLPKQFRTTRILFAKSILFHVVYHDVYFNMIKKNLFNQL